MAIFIPLSFFSLPNVERLTRLNMSAGAYDLPYSLTFFSHELNQCNFIIVVFKSWLFFDPPKRLSAYPPCQVGELSGCSFSVSLSSFSLISLNFFLVSCNSEERSVALLSVDGMLLKGESRSRLKLRERTSHRV